MTSLSLAVGIFLLFAPTRAAQADEQREWPLPKTCDGLHLLCKEKGNQNACEAAERMKCGELHHGDHGDHADHGDGRGWSRCEHFRDPSGPSRQGRICTFRSVSLRAESARRRHEAVRPPPLSALKCRSLSREEVLGDWAEGERGQILQHLYLFALTVP